MHNGQFFTQSYLASMNITRCTNNFCKRLFQLNQFSRNAELTIEAGRILCPHCGTTTMGDNNSIFLTHALSQQDEARLDANAS
jgi:homoserine acetyltransferase